jgi:NAD(P)-dependent dehydrogenase (short-subunit alcohol dehydrogenase family)
MTKKLKGRTAVVTGGGGGIGRGICLAMAEEGAGVVVNDVGKGAADKVVDEIKKTGGEAIASYDSIATMQGGQNVIKATFDKFGRVDILVNCAAIVWDRSIVDMTEKEWDSLLDVQLKGYFSTVKAAIPDMIKRKSGRIINFSSRAAVFGSPNAAYSTAKAAILGLTVNLSVELKKYGITANTVIPSAETATFSRPLNALDNIGFGLGDGMPVTPVRDPDYIAPIVVYLATDEAKNITAQFIYSSGGDICIYARPFQLPGPHQFIRKNDKWTIDELIKVMPTLIKQG